MAPARFASFSARFRAVGIEKIGLVPDFHQALGLCLGIDPEFGEDCIHVFPLAKARLVGDVAHMQDEVRLQHLFERGAECGDQRSGKLGDEADGVGQNGLRAAGERQSANGRVERREQRILGEHRGAGECVEQSRFAGVGVADERG